MGLTVDELIAHTLEAEGGYTDDPVDSGNWCKNEDGEKILVGTNWGIAAPTLKQHLKRTPTKTEMETLPMETAIEIYKHQYFIKPKMDKLPPEIQPNVFDMGVNAGPGTAIKILQRLLDENGFDPNGIDGGIGDGCLKACEEAVASGLDLRNLYSDARIAYYQDLCERKPAYQKYLNGWTNRANEFRAVG